MRFPRNWYNVLADAPTAPQPVLHPGTGQPIGPDDLAPLFPMDLILQEVSTDREIPIPDEVIDVLRLWRPRRCIAPSPGARHRHPLAHLLQERECLARGFAQA